MIEEMQDEAAALLSAGEYDHALAEFSVLAEMRSRREGPYSVMYLSNLHDRVRCMEHLGLWRQCDGVCRELHGKYVRTHGPGQADTVDVARRWASSLVHLNDHRAAAQLYLTTADALWDADRDQAMALLQMTVDNRGTTDLTALIGPEASSTRIVLAHRDEIGAAVTALLRD